MGLTAVAYKGLELTDFEGDFDIDDIYFHYRFNNYEDRASEVENGACYTFKDCECVIDYSYSSHYAFRAELAKMSGSIAEDIWKNGDADIPFIKLINFSDCEGVIGASISAKLAIDFSNNQGLADAHINEQFKIDYRSWRKGFEFASENGCVNFR